MYKYCAISIAITAGYANADTALPYFVVVKQSSKVAPAAPPAPQLWVCVHL